MKPQAQAQGEASPRDRGWWHDPESGNWPLAGLALLLTAQFTLIFTRAVNWDEFYFYHQVAAFGEGQLDSALQTLNTRLFFWLPGLFETSVDHILAARVTMYACQLVTLAAIYLLARRFADRITALLCPLLYLSAGYVLQHGFSFRVDPMVTALLMSALAVLARSRLDTKGIIAFGLLAGIAGMVTIKAVLYLPAFAGIALMRLQEDGWRAQTWLRLTVCGATALAVFAAIYAWHSAAVTQATGAGEVSNRLLDESASWMFFLGIPPYWNMGVKAAMFAPILLACALATPFLLWRSDRPLAEKIGLTGLWLPLLTPFYYMNTAGYFYVYMLAPLATSCLVALGWARTRFAPMLIAVALVSIACGIFLLEDRSTIDRQRQLERNVHEIFPEPVTYFDHNFMLGAWPKANGFMTPWLMNIYRSGGRDDYRAAMERDTVPLLLANWWTLRVMMDGSDDTLLSPADNAALRENYVEFAPFIFVAGKIVDGVAVQQEEFLVPGPYTVEGATIVIDGVRHAPGAIVSIDRGMHMLSAPDGSARLVWGRGLKRPSEPLTPGPLYVGF